MKVDVGGIVVRCCHVSIRVAKSEWRLGSGRVVFLNLSTWQCTRFKSGLYVSATSDISLRILTFFSPSTALHALQHYYRCPRDNLNKLVRMASLKPTYVVLPRDPVCPNAGIAFSQRKGRTGREQKVVLLTRSHVIGKQIQTSGGMIYREDKQSMEVILTPDLKAELKAIMNGVGASTWAISSNFHCRYQLTHIRSLRAIDLNLSPSSLSPVHRFQRNWESVMAPMDFELTLLPTISLASHGLQNDSSRYAS